MSDDIPSWGADLIGKVATLTERLDQWMQTEEDRIKTLETTSATRDMLSTLEGRVNVVEGDIRVMKTHPAIKRLTTTLITYFLAGVAGAAATTFFAWLISIHI